MVDVIQTEKPKVNNKKSYRFLKRTFDIVVSVLALLVLLLPMAVVALLIRIESPGPVIYKQERLGKNGKIFMMYKFRSMRMDAELSGPQWAAEKDPRCTKMGSVMRPWRIDELPQMWNVLKGDMTIVGPRPERECFYKEFEKEVPLYRDRMMVDQGLTGLAQLNGGYDQSPQDRYYYDMEYIRTQSIWTDVKCLFKTIPVLFNHEGAR